MVIRRSPCITALLSSLIIISTGCGGGGAAAPPPPPPSTVAITFPAPMPVTVAQKTGTGNWAATSLPSNGTLVLQLPSGTTQYGVAFVCKYTVSGNPVNAEWVLEADLKDGAAYSVQLCSSDIFTPPTGSSTGTFDATAIPGTSSVEISLNGFSRNATFAATTGSFNITALTGTTDLYAVAFNSSNVPLAMKIVRGQTVPGGTNGGNTITLNASDAITTVLPISVANTPGGSFNPPQIVHFPSYVTAHGSFPVEIGGSFIPTQYVVLPAGATQPDDFYLFDLIAGATTQEVFTRQYLKATGPVTLTLPNPWAATPPTPATFPSFTFNYAGLAGQLAVSDNAQIGWTQGSTAFAINVIATANHQNGATTVTIPDLTSLPGFLSMAPSGTKITWVVTTWGGTVQFYSGATAVPQTLSSALDQGSYTQP